MLQIKQKNLSEVCPQCCKLIDSSANRLIHDSCGHLKCRICLLQEITGCLVCVTEKKSSNQISTTKTSNNSVNTELQPRKSVITSLAIQIAEQKKNEDPKSLPAVDKDTCHVIKQSLEKDILFPTDIVNRSSGNFYHLKRVFSQRFFNEDNNKKHKACETEKNWIEISQKDEKCEGENLEKNNFKIPSHIEVQYFCKVHKITILDKDDVTNHHMACSEESNKGDNLMFGCKICGKSYRVVGKLNRHMKVHTKTSKFKCGKCGKTCTDNYALRTHERSHTHQKPYACQYCDKRFSGLQNFKRHEKKHRNEKKFVCDDCGFRFLTKTELKRHGVTHTNVKSFSCSLCTSKFAFKRTLVRHMKIHDDNLSRIKCPDCESTFKRKDNLERHLKTSHFEIKIEKCDDQTPI